MGLLNGSLNILVVIILLLETCQSKSDVGLTPPQIIANHGYPVETHEVQTQDGYLLTIHRIPYRTYNERNPTSTPVFLMHGLGSNSAEYIYSGSSSLGFILVELGYDVWLGNARGNTWSARHITLDPVKNPKAFFNYSWHEIGTKDLPASIDHILNKTGASNLYYIGYSQGSTSFCVMASSMPEYNKKVRLASFLAPPIYMNNIRFAELQIISRSIESVQKILEGLGIFHLPYVAEIRLTLRGLCTKDEFRDLCFRGYNFFVGYEDDQQFNWEWFPVYLTNNPADISLKQLFHYGQEIHSGHFRQFDHGEEGNLRAYGAKVPPDYNLSAIIAPVAIYYGYNDKLVSVQDARRTVMELPNVVKDYLIPYEKFNHGDFTFAVDARTLLYDEVIRTIQEH